METERSRPSGQSLDFSTSDPIAISRRNLMLLFVCTLMIGAGFSSLGHAAHVNGEQRAAIVDAVTEKLRELYVYPDIGERMAQRVATKLEEGLYDAIDVLEEFVAQLNRDLLSVFPDGHLAVSVLRKRERAQSSDGDWWQEHVENSRFNNCGFHRLDRMAGNVGYLELTEFDYPEVAGETLIAAMNYLCHTDAIIIDLRQNPGGRGELVQILLSYFFEDHRVHYLTELDGVRKITRQWWTLPLVPGKRMPHIPLYVLTSANTGSAAEEFAFALKNQKRATIVGATTAGAAHKTHRHTYPELRIEIYMPDGRSFDPVSKKDWEGGGVAPDVPVDPNRALEAAHLMAIEKLLEGEQREGRRFRLEWAHRDLRAQHSPIVLDEQEQQSYVGAYDARTITLEEGTLYYQRENRPRFVLVPLGDWWFKLEGLDYFRIRFDTDESGAVTTLVGVYDDGSESPSPRTSD